MSFPTIDDTLLARLDQPIPRYTSYPTAPAWRTDFGPDQLSEALGQAEGREGPLSLYVHIPFCREMCSYCGCNVVVSRDSARAARYVDVLIAELDLVSRQLKGRRQLSRVHLGGGTPTFLEERQLVRLANAIEASFELVPDAELAVEVDPVVTRDSQIDILAGLGWNRISFGVQDFDPSVQAAVNRLQSVEDTARAVNASRAAGFTSVNFDLIYGLPRQTAETWRRTLEQVVALGPDRLAVYSFAYLPSLRPNQRRLVASEVPEARAKLELLRLTHDVLLAAGYEAIGIDHFARPTDELARARRERRLWRDFQGYTVRRAGDTVAVGSSGISTLEGAIAQSTRALGQHAAAVMAGRLATERGLWLSEDDRRRRDIITQLMCNDWVDLGQDGEETYATELQRLRGFVEDGLCEVAGTQVSLTALGRLLARIPASVFDTYLERGDRYSRAISRPSRSASTQRAVPGRDGARPRRRARLPLGRRHLGAVRALRRQRHVHRAHRRAAPGAARLAQGPRAFRPRRDRPPSEVELRTSLPKTRSGKIVRRYLKAIEMGESPGDLSTLAD